MIIYVVNGLAIRQMEVPVGFKLGALEFESYAEADAYVRKRVEEEAKALAQRFSFERRVERLEADTGVPLVHLLKGRCSRTQLEQMVAALEAAWGI